MSDLNDTRRWARIEAKSDALSMHARARYAMSMCRIVSILWINEESVGTVVLPCPFPEGKRLWGAVADILFFDAMAI